MNKSTVQWHNVSMDMSMFESIEIPNGNQQSNNRVVVSTHVQQQQLISTALPYVTRLLKENHIEIMNNCVAGIQSGIVIDFNDQLEAKTYGFHLVHDLKQYEHTTFKNLIKYCNCNIHKYPVMVCQNNIKVCFIIQRGDVE